MVLLSDFLNLITDAGLPLVLDTPELRQELHLLYVALTRAMESIEVNEQIQAVLRYCETAGVVGEAVEPVAKHTEQVGPIAGC